MAPTSILVLGAGELGRAILEALVSHPAKGDTGTSISVLLRPATINSQNPSKQKDVADLRALGITVVSGDVVNDTPEQLSALFGRYDTIINATGMYAPPGTQIRICHAVLTSSCRRYFPWQFGVDYDLIGPNSSQDLFTEQLGVRTLLRGQSKVEWVIVSTGMFTSFLFEPSTGLVNAERDAVMAIGSWENAITVTSPRDIGRVTAEIALAAPEVEGVVFVAGDTVSMLRLAEIVEGVTGKMVRRTLKTVPVLQAELAEKPDDASLKYQVVFGEGIGVAWKKERTFNALRGMEMESAEEWARKHLAR